ncbi:hypothetical protein EI168_02635 [Halomonas sp. FME1]|uniref:Uncharacterized protein n=1 Tax=Halomonas casei TaxID=2742613 RepID=A0ABR9F175_9GAMM|nr:MULTISPECIES: hypothetical protein [Halomonas]MBE0399005.1 hypothetical protein [Halomonas casei]PCC23009.1 hypothetical protein CIK78_13610 [Halomonas sp. JB37]
MNVQDENIDMEQLCSDLTRVVVDHYLDGLNHETSMQVIRRACDEAGTMIGRILAAAQHEGPISGDLLMEMRASEEDFKYRLLNSARLFGPGQILRTHLEDIAHRRQNSQ